MRPPPQSEGVFFVADEAATLAAFEGAASQSGSGGRVGAGFFFLKPLQEAGKSVASIKATALSQRVAVWISGARSASLIWRNPMTPTRSRKALRIRASGTSCLCRNRAKERQARCSGSMATSKLSECTGVKRAKRCTRQSWAALKCQRGPRAGRWFQWSLMKSSGIYGSSMVSNWLVPVSGSVFMVKEATHLKPLRLAFCAQHGFSSYKPEYQLLTQKLVTPSFRMKVENDVLCVNHED
jgi:hypothetical protein